MLFFVLRFHIIVTLCWLLKLRIELNYMNEWMLLEGIILWSEADIASAQSASGSTALLTLFRLSLYPILAYLSGLVIFLVFPHAKCLVAVLLQGYQSCPQEDRFPFRLHIPDTLKALVGRISVPTRPVEVSDSTTPQEWYYSWSQDSVNLPGFCILFCHSPPSTRLLIVYRVVFLLILEILTRPCVCFSWCDKPFSLLVLYLLVLNLSFQEASWVGRENSCTRRNPNFLFS